MGTLVVLAVHLVAFAILFHSQDDPAYLIPEPEFDDPKSDRDNSAGTMGQSDSTFGVPASAPAPAPSPTPTRRKSKRRTSAHSTARSSARPSARPTQFIGPCENGMKADSWCMNVLGSGLELRGDEKHIEEGSRGEMGGRASESGMRPEATSQRSGQKASGCVKLRGSRCRE